MDLGKGIIGAIAGGAAGYAKGKQNEAESIHKDNLFVIQSIFDKNMQQFRHELGLKRDELEHTRDIEKEKSRREWERQQTLDSRSWEKEQTESERKWESERAEAERRWKLANREPKAPQGEYAYNPNTGQQVWVPKGTAPPEGFVVKDFYDNKGPDIDIAKQNFMGKYGVYEDPTGGFVSEPMTAEQKAQAEAEAKQMGLNIYFKKGTDDGGWFGKSKDVYTISSIAPAMEGRGIVGGYASGDRGLGQPQEQGVDRRDGNWHKAPDGNMYRWDARVGKWEVDKGRANAAPEENRKTSMTPGQKPLPTKDELAAAAENPPTTPRNPNEAVYGREEPGKSLITSAQELMNKTRVDKNNPQFGEGPIESTLRLQGRGKSLHERKLMADRIRERYPKLSDEQIAKILREEIQ